MRRSYGDEEQVSLEIVSMRPQEFQRLRNRNFYRYGFTTNSPNAASGYMGYNMLQFRIDVDRFKLRKKQSKILRQFDRFLEGRNPINSKAPQTKKQHESSLKGLDQSDIEAQSKKLRVLQLKTALEKALQSIKDDAEQPVELAPYGVKICGEASGIKCIFMDKGHSGLYEDKLLNRFLLNLAKEEDSSLTDA